MAAKRIEDLSKKEIVALLVELAEEGKVYAVACSPGKSYDFLVYLPSTLGAYWLVRGKPTKDFPRRDKGDRTWKQVDKSLAPGIIPDLSVAPKLKPDSMSVYRWLGEVPMVWFANSRRYSSA